MVDGNRSKVFMIKAWLLKYAAASLALVSRNRLPPLSAVAAIVERDGELLMVDRSDGMGFSLPGGIMRWNESTDDTVRREVREETGYDVEVLGLFNNYSGPERDSRFSSVCLAYTASVVDGEMRASNEGRPRWVPFDEVMELRLAFDVREVIGDYLAQK